MGNVIKGNFGKGRPTGGRGTGTHETVKPESNTPAHHDASGLTRAQLQLAEARINGNPTVRHAFTQLQKLHGTRGIIEPFDNIEGIDPSGRSYKGYALLIHFPATAQSFMMGFAEGSQFVGVIQVTPLLGQGEQAFHRLPMYPTYMVQLSATYQRRADAELAAAVVKKTLTGESSKLHYQPLRAEEMPTLFPFLNIKELHGNLANLSHVVEQMESKTLAQRPPLADAVTDAIAKKTPNVRRLDAISPEVLARAETAMRDLAMSNGHLVENVTALRGHPKVSQAALKERTQKARKLVDYYNDDTDGFHGQFVSGTASIFMSRHPSSRTGALELSGELQVKLHGPQPQGRGPMLSMHIDHLENAGEVIEIARLMVEIREASPIYPIPAHARNFAEAVEKLDAAILTLEGRDPRPHAALDQRQRFAVAEAGTIHPAAPTPRVHSKPIVEIV